MDRGRTNHVNGYIPWNTELTDLELLDAQKNGRKIDEEPCAPVTNEEKLPALEFSVPPNPDPVSVYNRARSHLQEPAVPLHRMPEGPMGIQGRQGMLGNSIYHQSEIGQPLQTHTNLPQQILVPVLPEQHVPIVRYETPADWQRRTNSMYFPDQAPNYHQCDFRAFVEWTRPSLRTVGEPPIYCEPNPRMPQVHQDNLHYSQVSSRGYPQYSHVHSEGNVHHPQIRTQWTSLQPQVSTQSNLQSPQSSLHNYRANSLTDLLYPKVDFQGNPIVAQLIHPNLHGPKVQQSGNS